MSIQTRVFSLHLGSAICEGAGEPIYGAASGKNGLGVRGGKAGGGPGGPGSCARSLYPSDGYFQITGRLESTAPEIEFLAFAGLCALVWGQGGLFAGFTLEQAVRGPLLLRGVCVQTTDHMRVVRLLQGTAMHRLVAAAVRLLGEEPLDRQVRRILLSMQTEKAVGLLLNLK